VQGIRHESGSTFREHKLLLTMAVLAVMYCFGAPAVANLLTHLGQ
jgi:Tfp pilus assembly protein FimT